VTVYSAAATPLRPAPAQAGPRQGDRVYTIGNPVGLRNTVTAGIFSGYRRHEDSGEIYLQTDAPINPGNSGGPLIDERGRVLGVNTMILQNTQGIGFAIPVTTVFEEFSLMPPMTGD
jgi:S1-C subfamily serine protease